MQSLMPTIDSSDKLFHDGNPLTGEKGTIVTSAFLNNAQGAVRDTQTELIAILTAAGLAPDGVTNGQLLSALQKLMLVRKNPFSDIASDGSTAISLALSNLGVFKKSSFSASDFLRLPDVSGGIILQWAKIKSDSNGMCSWTYPTPFPSARLATWGVCHRTNVSGTDSPTISFDDVTDPSPKILSNFNLRVNGTTGSFSAFVFALGY